MGDVDPAGVIAVGLLLLLLLLFLLPGTAGGCGEGEYGWSVPENVVVAFDR